MTTPVLSAAFTLIARHNPSLVRFSREGIADYTDTPPPGYVRRQGKIFEVGEYPTKKFSLTEEEADKAIEGFRPVTADLEHFPTILDGKLGVLRRIWRDGKSIFGAADVPEWLDTQLKDTASTVSCAWDRASKHLIGWGWVKEPHVQDAALVSTFAAFAVEQPALAAVKADALVYSASQGALESTPEETRSASMPILGDAIQAAAARRGLGSASGVINFSQGGQGIPQDTATPTAPAPSPTPITPAAPTTPSVPSPQAPPAPTPTPTPTAPAPAPTTPGTPAGTAAQQQAQFRADLIVNSAEEAADALIESGQLFPAGRGAAIALFSVLGFDNEATGQPPVTFAREDGSIVSDRVSMLKEVFRAVPRHALFGQGLPAIVLNGNHGKKAAGETPEEQGRQQAAAFNQTMFPNLAAPTAPDGNGNGHK
jgi:hypothetical protein